MINVYADNKGIKALENARQGFVAAIQDIENHIPGQNSSRVHEEEHGRVLCQSDSQQQTWHAAGRFVYGTDAPKEKALCVGHTPEHQKQNGRAEYIKLRKMAARTKISDFKNKILLSSKQILQPTETIADDIIPPQQLPRLELLQTEYNDWVSCFGEEGREEFKKILKESLLKDGKLTNSEKKSLMRLQKDDPFRVDMETTIAQIDAESANQKPLPTISFLSAPNNPSR